LPPEAPSLVGGEDVSTYWIKNYPKESSFENFFPHITIGIGEVEGEISGIKFPIKFNASKLALCHLGNYCTFRKIFLSYDLGMKSKFPLVSIGMPVYNGEKYIRQALDSLLGQTYKNFELIISDNASTDETKNICEEYAKRDKRIKYIRQKENMGGANNLRFVLEQATGEYFMWAAHDDRREPSAIKSALSCFMTNGNIVFAGSYFDIINYVTGHTKEHSDIPKLSEGNNAFQNCCLLLRQPEPSFIYGLFRTDTLKKTHFIAIDYFDFGDVYLLYEIATMGKMRIVPLVLYHAGVVEAVRTPKSCAKCKLPGFKFGYSKYYFESLKLFLRSKSFSHRQKLHLVQLLNSQVVGLVIGHEKVKIGHYGIYILRTIKYMMGHYVNKDKQNAIRKKRLNFYSQFIKSGDLCFDIGANVGNRIDVFLELGAKVVTVEPQESCLKVLRDRYQSNPHVEIVSKGVAAREGTIALWICDEISTISSMSDRWRSAVIESGRFASYHWHKKTLIPVTTLDVLIQQYGVPKFCKIDVEGFEYEVLKGLSQPIPFLSFEFTYPEYFAQAKACMSYLCLLDKVEFNLSVGESMSLLFPHWVTQEEIEKKIELLENKIVFGDIYVHHIGS